MCVCVPVLGCPIVLLMMITMRRRLPRTDIFANGDGYFTYPGTQGPLGTVRLAAIRDGLEDVELFRALGAKRSAPLLARLVRTATDWTADPSLLASTRRQALQMLASS